MLQFFLFVRKSLPNFAQKNKKMEKTIGARIQSIVQKRGLSVTEFANQINCVRQNVHNIFKRNNIDIDLLRRISEVLGHNFFSDLANDPGLSVRTDDDIDSIAIAQFHKSIDMVMKDLGIDGCICYGRGELVTDDIPLPDFTLVPYFITFTVGETFQQRTKGLLDNIMTFNLITDEEGKMTIIECINGYTGLQFLDIKLDYKTEQEWTDYVSFALRTAEIIYLKPTRDLIKKYKAV